MDIKSTQKFIRVSPQKARVVANLIRKLTPVKALEVLPYINKKVSEEFEKVVKTALANARQAGLSDDMMIFKEVQVGESTRLKRGRPVSRGMWHPYVRRMSHIRIVLTEKPTIVEKTEKIEKKEKAKNEEVIETEVVSDGKPSKKAVSAKKIKKEIKK